MNPQFPIYIPSKGRADTRLTMIELDRLRVPYRVIVEKQEFAAYAAVIDKKRLLVLDPKYQRDYDTFWKIPDNAPRGSGPARNFAWDHSESEGHAWHWVMDDNIETFWRMNKNLRVPVGGGSIFAAMESFCMRYKNVGMGGPNYLWQQTNRKSKHPPFMLNTRIYSCNLIRNATAFRWRGRYNEDTDLSLRMLKAGWCTIQFFAFLQRKMTTLTMSGGNTDSIYTDGTFDKSRMLCAMHPDVSKLSWKFRRWHHHVDYRSFKQNRLIRDPSVTVLDAVDEFGMKLIHVEKGHYARNKKAIR